MDRKLSERGKEVNLSHLHVFCYLSYVHIDYKARNMLDPKLRTCTFIGYGTDELGYRFWDDQNKKIIRSKNVVFIEKVMYNKRMGTESRSIEAQVAKTGYVELEEPSEIEDFGDENTLANTVLQQEPVTPGFTIRRSIRVFRPTHRYSSSLHYLLLTDGGEPESYEDVLKVDYSVK